MVFATDGVIRLLNRETEPSEYRQTDPQPGRCKLRDDLVDDLMNWPDSAGETELQARGREILRNTSVARRRRDLAAAAEAWDRIRDIQKPEDSINAH